MTDSKLLCELFQRLKPLSAIADIYLPQLSEKAIITDFNCNDTLVRSQPVGHPLYHYLVQGEIEYRVSMMERTHLYHSETDDWCLQPLEYLVEKKGGSIRAKSSGQLLIVSKSYVDELVDFSINSSASKEQLVNLSELSDAPLIDDHYEEDWNEAFLSSPLATNLSPKELQQFFRLMVDHEFSNGDIIVRENSFGDTFYLIKSGSVEVSCGAAGPLREPIALWPGDYFGDDSLIAGTPRNATVTMMEDGALGCLDKESFDDIFRRALIKTIDDSDINAMPFDQKELIWIDVRLPIEFRQDHLSNSINYPISTLRRHLSDLDRSARYLVNPNGGCRSELATYLLRQHGLDAYLYLQAAPSIATG